MAAPSSASSLGSSPFFLGQKLPSNNTTFSTPAPSCVKFRSSPVAAATYTSGENTRSPHLYSSNMASPASLYEVLGIPKGATCQEIKSAYRRLARVCHPDAVATDQKDTSANEFMKIHAAYSTLADPQKRADYDRDLFSSRQRLLYRSPSSASAYAAYAASSMSGFSGSTRRNWETDQCW
ncbi:chaperone protein dnaJ 11, chloroplastic-like [Telopea speciosissima]|uniref:chaperone protein dnaJ 11, chloroplastic-like n=1 Tax=Telopea speciosissima TaxID=54955 RepID=UPI001CC50E71|nr:chaperone protein dnaJ 11, chloroplastic-like [Telopea speciosissima]